MLDVICWYMVQEEFEVIEDTAEIEFLGDALNVLVSVDRYEEEYKGSSRDEDYYERTDLDGDVFGVECPLEYIYKDSNPDEGYTGGDAVSFVQNESWDSMEVVDIETMEFRKDGDLWIATFDSSPLDEYQY